MSRLQRLNSWTKSRQKSSEFSFLLFTVASTTALPWDFYFFKLALSLTISEVQLLLVKEKEKNLIENHTPCVWIKKSPKKPHVWELSRLWPETSTKLYSYVHEFGFRKKENLLYCQCRKTCLLHFHLETERFSEKNMKLKRLQNKGGKNGHEINLQRFRKYKRRKKGVGESIGEN